MSTKIETRCFLGLPDLDWGLGTLGDSSWVHSCVSAAGEKLSGWDSLGLNFNNVRRFQERAYQRLNRHHKPRGGRKSIPLKGAYSKDPAERGAAYLRRKLDGRDLPKFSEIFRNMYGEAPKKADYKGNEAAYEEARSRYDELKKQEKKRDAAMRLVAEKIVGEWMNDPEARRGFARKMSLATNDAERTRAFLDPKGDGAYLQQLGQIVPGIQNANDQETMMKNWEKVSQWFAGNVGAGVMGAMMNETGATVNAKGYPGESPLDRNAAIKKVTDRGYTREEAEALLKGFTSMEQVDDLTKFMRPLQPGERMDHIDSLRKKRETAVAELEAFMSRSKPPAEQAHSRITGTSKAEKAAKAEQDDSYRRAWENEWEAYEQGLRQRRDGILEIDNEIKRANEARAKQLLEDVMPVASLIFGRRPETMGYRSGELPQGVASVRNAIEWLHGDGTFTREELPAVPSIEGIRPQATETAPAPEAADAARDNRSSGGRGSGGGSQPQAPQPTTAPTNPTQVPQPTTTPDPATPTDPVSPKQPSENEIKKAMERILDNNPSHGPFINESIDVGNYTCRVTGGRNNDEEIILESSTCELKK